MIIIKILSFSLRFIDGGYGNDLLLGGMGKDLIKGNNGLNFCYHAEQVTRCYNWQNTISSQFT